ncbi:MAG: S-adenosylmethionine:tRNA ribosyltransferase-isomerase [Candidatus Shikimatogenerans sp. JK-2022]|nr:S-adenosylmethionine:tRNA ribosyltransferase-isomerase [Candidatus Shikimatogenerans bostrichidophilus]
MLDLTIFKDLLSLNKNIKNYPRKYTEPKLMIYYKNLNLIKHDKFYNIYKYFNINDIILYNNSRAYPIKYNAYKIKNNKKSFIDIYLRKELNKEKKIWDILVNPARKVRIGNKLYFDNINNKTISSVILNNTTSKGRILKFNFTKSNFLFKKFLFPTGKFLLPPNTIYNKNIPINRYQNSYAKTIGSIILPTIGTYLNKHILLNLQLKFIKFFPITFHLNFNKIYRFNKLNFTKKNNINSEKLIFKKKIIQNINNAYNNNKIRCSFGGNTLRAIESIIYKNKYLYPFKGYINHILPYPYKYKFFNSLLTYFNNIDSLNFLSILNLCGFKNTYKIYKIALKNKYKFYTYGDLLLII